MKFPPFKSLQVFLGICKHSSFSGAAKELCLTHSAVSYSLKQLEVFLGVKLVNRTTRLVSLTKEGKIYRDGISKALRQIEVATSKVMVKYNVVRLNVMHSLALKFLIPKIRSLKSFLGNTDIQISTEFDSIENLFKNNVDIALVYDHKESLQGYSAHLFRKDFLVLVGAPGRKVYSNASVNALASETLLTVSDPLRVNDWSDWHRTLGLPFSEKNVKTMRFQSTIQALEAATSGLGVFVTHLIFVENALKNGDLQLLSPHQVPTKKNYYLVTRKDIHNSHDIKQCVKWFMSQKSD